MRRADYVRLLILVLLIVGITALHYLTTIQKAHFHDIYRRLYYIPILLGGLWFSLRGGLATAISVSILFAPHVVFQWGHHPTADPEQYLEIILYNIVGFLTGFLTEREKIQKLRYQKTAERLETSYGELRRQADQILEIEEQLRRADRLSALGELAAGMAHEIRNPLGSIRGTAEILQDGVEASDPRYEFTRILIREVDRLNGVVQNFLDFARPGTIRPGRIDLNQVLGEILDLVRPQCLKAGITAELLGDGLPAAAGDQGQLKQAFLNLVLNAIQAMPQGGRLTLDRAVAAGWARIHVRDSGQGIPAENLDRVFNPFFTTRPDGTGLGLAITHRIIDGNGGKISVASRVGEGTTFTIDLPLADAPYSGTSAAQE